MKKVKCHSKKIIALILLTTLVWGSGRLYFSITDGFMESNILSDLPADPVRELRNFTDAEQNEWMVLSQQPWYYLGKGCQSYVFESEDGKYVLKFFKYQRFRPQFWLEALSFLPPIKAYLDKKMVTKQEKLAFFMEAWKVAFEELKEESGLVYVHLNKSTHLNSDFVLYDKIGMKHVIAADQVEFLVQRKAESLVPWIKEHMFSKNVADVKGLLDNLITTLVSEYQRGLSDDDPALMQNTGVFDNKMFHIDVGQFTKGDKYRDPGIWHQALYNKTYYFRLWLLRNYPEMGEYLTERLKGELGDNYEAMKPFFGRIH